jgi:hypothetical protein
MRSVDKFKRPRVPGASVYGSRMNPNRSIGVPSRTHFMPRISIRALGCGGNGERLSMVSAAPTPIG